MNCEASRILISAYLDDELSEDERLQLKTHLQQCGDCVLHLQHQESLQRALKHSLLVQPAPQIPANFATNVAEELRRQTKSEGKSLVQRFRASYRSAVFGVIESWTNSLRIRPYAWTSAVSCALVLMVGLLSYEVAQYATPQPALQFAQNAARESVPPLSASVQTRSSARVASEAVQKAAFEHEGKSPVRFEVQENDMAQTVASAEAEQDMFFEADSPVEITADSRFIRVASNETTAASVEDYVYSHVVEAYQTHFVDDAVFVGYVQDTFIQ